MDVEAARARGFEEFVKGYADRAFGFAFRLCGNVEDAHEHVQESFLRVLRHWDSLEPGMPMENWYFRVLRNLTADAHRRSERHQALPLDMTPPGCGTHPLSEVVADGRGSTLDALEREERDRAVRAALDAVPPDQRAVLVLVDMEGRSYDEIAAILDVPVGTVRSRVSRARLAFRAALSKTPEVTP